VKTTILGIDRSTYPRKTAIAAAVHNRQWTSVHSVQLGTADGSHIDKAVKLLCGGTATLIAIDAPLGWLKRLGRTLATHKVGAHIAVQSDKLLHRVTDDMVNRELKKKPLEVGADRIAPTGIEYPASST